MRSGFCHVTSPSIANYCRPHSHRIVPQSTKLQVQVIYKKNKTHKKNTAELSLREITDVNF